MMLVLSVFAALCQVLQLVLWLPGWLVCNAEAVVAVIV
jgi:hypothetical protein